MRYDTLMDGTTPKRSTRMVRVVDAQGYHLRWIEVPVEEDEPKRTGPQGEDRLRSATHDRP